MLASSTTDWITAIASAFAAVGTVGAVIVALWGPRWRQERKRPKLTLGVECDWKAGMIYLTVTNDKRKDTAIDVELHVIDANRAAGHGPYAPGEMSAHQPKIGRPLAATESLDVAASQSIPAGFTRRWNFVRHNDLKSDCTDELAAFLDKPSVPLMVLPEEDELMKRWLWRTLPDTDAPRVSRAREAPARIRLAVAGSNVPAHDYVVHFGFDPIALGMYEHSIKAWFYVAIDATA